MKVVIDTNIFISGVFFSGPPYRILQAWRNGDLQIVLSLEILDEYYRIGEALSAQFPKVDLNPILELITTKAELVEDYRRGDFPSLP